jgi:HEAT repeat protein
VLRGPQLLDAVRAMIVHPRWHLRMEAAKALGRIGLPDDLPRLEGLLGDAQWWVRYRAAQSIVRLPFLSRTELERLRARQTDRYARDILAHVLAERALA